MRIALMTIVILVFVPVASLPLVAENLHQVGASASGRSGNQSGSLELLAGQTISGSAGDLTEGFLSLGDGRYYLPGDADGNLYLNISDAVYVIGYIFGDNPAPDPYISGDGDCNRVVNISDALVIIGHVFGGQSAPAFCD